MTPPVGDADRFAGTLRAALGASLGAAGIAAVLLAVGLHSAGAVAIKRIGAHFRKLGLKKVERGHRRGRHHHRLRHWQVSSDHRCESDRGTTQHQPDGVAPARRPLLGDVVFAMEGRALLARVPRRRPLHQQPGLHRLHQWLQANPQTRLVVIDVIARLRVPNARGETEFFCSKF